MRNLTLLCPGSQELRTVIEDNPGSRTRRRLTCVCDRGSARRGTQRRVPETPCLHAPPRQNHRPRWPLSITPHSRSIEQQLLNCVRCARVRHPWPPSAPRAHQIERGTAGNHGESCRVCRVRNRPFQQVSPYNWYSVSAASQAERSRRCPCTPRSHRRSRQKGTVARGFQLSSTSPRASSNSWRM